METYLVDLTLKETFTIPQESDRDFREVAGRLAAKMREGFMTLDSFISVEEIMDADNHDDGQIPVVCNETLFEIVLLVDDSVDLNDGGEELYYYVAEALEHRDGRVEVQFSVEGKDCERTIARIYLEGTHTPGTANQYPE